MITGLAIIICSLIFSLVGLVVTGFIGYAVYTFAKTIKPYQFDKLKGRKISNTKIQKIMDEKVFGDAELWIQEPIMLNLFPDGIAYATEKKAAPNFFVSLLKLAAPAIPSLVAGTPAQDIAVGQAANFAAGILGSEEGVEKIKGVWEFLKMIAQARKNKQVAIPKQIGSSTNKAEESTTI